MDNLMVHNSGLPALFFRSQWLLWKQIWKSEPDASVLTLIGVGGGVFGFVAGRLFFVGLNDGLGSGVIDAKFFGDLSLCEDYIDDAPALIDEFE